MKTHDFIDEGEEKRETAACVQTHQKAVRVGACNTRTTKIKQLPVYRPTMKQYV